VTPEAAAQLPPAGGVLLVDKPVGPTSHDVVQRVRRTLGDRRVGHTGTLDPIASGLLLLCVGPATRLSEYLSGFHKEYDALVRLGASTTTHDLEGDVTARSDAWRTLSPAQLEAALCGLEGRLLQVPPEFSAKKVGGEAAHRKARRGESVVLPAAEVWIHALELMDVDLPDVRVRWPGTGDVRWASART
jgi:tRNA pseudouridine55 synthase